jgi:hypothetical protein
VRKRIGAFRLPERLHDDGKLVRRNTFAIVFDDQVDATRIAFNAYLDDIAFTRELQGIGNQIDDDLPELHLVPKQNDIVVSGSANLSPAWYAGRQAHFFSAVAIDCTLTIISRTLLAKAAIANGWLPALAAWAIIPNNSARQVSNSAHSSRRSIIQRNSQNGDKVTLQRRRCCQARSRRLAKNLSG